MSRTVTVLYDSRAEAETARERLVTDLNARATRLIGKDTLAAMDDLKIDKKQGFTLRQALRRGAYVVIAEVPSGTTPDRVMSFLGLSAGTAKRSEGTAAPSPIRYGIANTHSAPEPVDDAEVNLSSERPAGQPSLISVPCPQEGAAATPSPSQVTSAAVNPRKPSALRTQSAGYTVLSGADAEAAGLFKERTIDFAEMREEAIVTKEAVVREEVIVTKTVKERTQTIRDTVRHTEFEIEPLEPRG